MKVHEKVPTLTSALFVERMLKAMSKAAQASSKECFLSHCLWALGWRQITAPRSSVPFGDIVGLDCSIDPVIWESPSAQSLVVTRLQVGSSKAVKLHESPLELAAHKLSQYLSACDGSIADACLAVVVVTPTTEEQCAVLGNHHRQYVVTNEAWLWGEANRHIVERRLQQIYEGVLLPLQALSQRHTGASQSVKLMQKVMAGWCQRPQKGWEKALLQLPLAVRCELSVIQQVTSLWSVRKPLPAGQWFALQKQYSMAFIVFCDDALQQRKVRKWLQKHQVGQSVLMVQTEQKDERMYLQLWLGERAIAPWQVKIIPSQTAIFAAFLQQLLWDRPVYYRSEVAMVATLAAHATRIRQTITSALKRESGNEEQLLKVPHEQEESDVTAVPASDGLRYWRRYFAAIESSEFADTMAQLMSIVALSYRRLHPQQPAVDLSFITSLQEQSEFLGRLLTPIIYLWRVKKVAFSMRQMLMFVWRLDTTAFATMSKHQEPILHDYEVFLAAYQQSTRKQRGVYYTPDAVVDFIVRSIDERFRSYFGLRLGLADPISWQQIAASQRGKELGIQVPKGAANKPFVVLFDPATGTGTFIKKALELIRKRMLVEWKEEPPVVQSQLWQAYVGGSGPYEGRGVLQRIHAFEVMPVPYAVAHLRLIDWLANHPKIPFCWQPTERLSVWLSNALLDADEEMAVTAESQGVRELKSRLLCTAVLGNPPYLGISRQHSAWISRLLETYKYVQGVHFGERKHWLHDDYVKFIRMAQFYLQRSGVGILGFINPHSFLDNPTFRGMRWQLWRFFDDLSIVNLHGSAKKNTQLDADEEDENLFDIRQGVSIQLFVKGTTSTDYGLVKYTELLGARKSKQQCLQRHTLQSLGWIELPTYHEHFDYFFMVPKDIRHLQSYMQGIALQQLFTATTSGIVTARDGVVVDMIEEDLVQRISWFGNLAHSDQDIRQQLFPRATAGKYAAGDTRGWKLTTARRRIANNQHAELIQQYSYRPFDKRFLYYSSDMVDWDRAAVMRDFINHDNLGIVYKRGDVEPLAAPVFITNGLIDFRSWSRPGMQGGDYVSPLYHWHANGKKQVNLNVRYAQALCEAIDCHFHTHEDRNRHQVSPENLVDYLYASLHNPHYKKQYADLLAHDYPRVPYPQARETFWQLVDYGFQLRQLHLFQSQCLQHVQVGFCGSGEASVEKLRFADGRVWINARQYFDDVSAYAWQAYIGGYQPAQKWLKDRKKQQVVLRPDDCLHYRRIIVVLEESRKVMEKIAKM